MSLGWASPHIKIVRNEKKASREKEKNDECEKECGNRHSAAIRLKWLQNIIKRISD